MPTTYSQKPSGTTRKQPDHYRVRRIVEIKDTPVVTCQDAVTKYLKWMEGISRPPLTVYHTKLVLNRFLEDEELDTRPIDEVDESIVSQWINRTGNKYSTRKYNLAVLSSFFRYFNIKGVTGIPPLLVRVSMENLTKSQKDTKPKLPFSEAEFKLLMDHLQKRFHESNEYETDSHPKATLKFWIIAVALGRYTGLRISDISQMEWASLTDNPGFIDVWTDKVDGVKVSVPVSPELKPYLELIGLNQKAGYVFPEQRHVYRDPKKRSKLNIQFKRLCEGAGVPDHTFHDLRYTFVQECRAKGLEMPHIAELVGHASTGMTDHYAQLSKFTVEQLEAQLKKMKADQLVNRRFPVQPVSDY